MNAYPYISWDAVLRLLRAYIVLPLSMDPHISWRYLYQASCLCMGEGLGVAAPPQPTTQLTIIRNALWEF
jgi:hypothetical protein